MSKRFSQYLLNKAELERATGQLKCDPIRVTPGQYAELTRELGQAPSTFMTCQGVHDIQVIELHTRATGDNVIMCPREDLFQETDREIGIELVSTSNAVTSVPDNVGCVEILSVGPLVPGFKAGEIVFIDFYRVKQGYIVSNEELYIANGDSLAAKYDPETQLILPIDNTVITRAAKTRFSTALNGTDRIIAPDTVLTDGIVSGRTSRGSAAARSVYQEIAHVGRLTNRASGCAMTNAERALIEALLRDDSYGDFSQWTSAVREERKNGRESDVKEGDLVTFCTDVALKVRCRGEYQWIVPYDSVLAVIDDEKILDAAVRRNAAGSIIRSR